MELTTTNGYKFKIDDKDYLAVRVYSWTWNRGRIHNVEAGYLHNYLLGFIGVDHINGDQTDNRRLNLRMATSSQNSMNRIKNSKRRSSKYKGVSYRKSHKKFVAFICKSGNNKFLGYFDDEREAALVYDQAAIEMFGEFACTNSQLFPDDFKPSLKSQER